MKKLFSCLLICLLVLALPACSTKKDENLMGGWNKPEDTSITQDLKTVFEKAVEGTEFEDYIPKELVGIQMVSGTNFKILCENGKTIMINQDLQGNCNVLNEDFSIVEKKH